MKDVHNIVNQDAGAYALIKVLRGIYARTWNNVMANLTCDAQNRNIIPTIWQIHKIFISIVNSAILMIFGRIVLKLFL